jgi:hypothetical protein
MEMSLGEAMGENPGNLGSEDWRRGFQGAGDLRQVNHSPPSIQSKSYLDVEGPSAIVRGYQAGSHPEPTARAF